jgi:hypothetical protein
MARMALFDGSVSTEEYGEILVSPVAPDSRYSMSSLLGCHHMQSLLLTAKHGETQTIPLFQRLC